MASGDSFNQGMILPGIITQLRQILQDYPDNGQILKELIQNAEDAGATRVRFLLDTNQRYPRDDKYLCAEGLGRFQGPALLAYNDAVFKDEDWIGIRMLLDSIKKDDPMKVGRFGLGFKSVFHITDLPSFISGEWIGFLDPHEIYFEEQQEIGGRNFIQRKSSYRFSLQDCGSIRHQLEPFCHDIFGFNLENVGASGNFNGTIFRFPLRDSTAESLISDTIYSEQRIFSLLHSLQHECHLNLLFLKYLEEIEIYKMNEHSYIIPSCFSVKLSEGDRIQTKNARSDLISNLESRGNKSSFSTIFCTSVTTENDSVTVSEDKYIVCHYYHDENTDLTKRDNVLPLVSLALPVHNDEETNEGQVFCFLPLPATDKKPTGLEFHVNGFFAVDHNRHHLKMQTAATEIEDRDIEWNDKLVTKLIPRAVAKLAGFIRSSPDNISLDSAGKLMQKLIPNYEKITPCWRRIIQPICSLLQSDAIYITQLSGGKWVDNREAHIFETGTPGQTAEIISNILKAGRICIVHPLQYHIVETFLQFSCKIPRFVNTELVVKTFLHVQGTIFLSNQERAILLSHIISAKSLQGLNLLLLKDKTTAVFSSSQPEVFIDQHDLASNVFSRIKHRFLDMENFSEVCQSKLQCMARQEQYQLRLFTAEWFDTLLRATVKTVPSLPFEDLDSDWLCRVWTFIYQNHISPSCLHGLRLLPKTQSMWIEINRNNPFVLCSWEGHHKLPFKLMQTLDKLGIATIEQLPHHILRCGKLLHFCCFPPTPDGIMKVVSTICADRRKENDFVHCFSKLSFEEVQSWRNFMTENIQNLRDRHAVCILKMLPMFCLIGHNNKLTSASSVKFAIKQADIPFNVHQDVIDSTLCEDLLNLCQVKCLDLDGVIQHLVVPSLKHDPWLYTIDQLRIVENIILTNVSIQSNISLLNVLKTVEFMETQSGALSAPTNLFCPVEEEILGLLLPPNKLPSKRVSNKSNKRVLLALGLKTSESLSEHDIVEMAKSVATMRIFYYGNSFAKFLEQQKSHLSSHSLRKSLWNLQWMPIIMNRKIVCYPEDIPFIGESITGGLECPSAAGSDEHSFLVGSVLPLISSREFPALSVTFDMNKPPSTANLLKQLQIIAKESHDVKSHYSSISKIYDLLQNRSVKEIKGILFDLKFREWVYHGAGFCEAHKLAISSLPVCLEPYAFTVPTEMKKFKKLFLSLGCRLNHDVYTVLDEIQAFHKQTRDQAISKKDLRTTLDIIGHLAATEDEPKNDLLIPVESNENHKLLLMPKNKCLQHDIAVHVKLVQEHYSELHLVHTAVSNETVAWLQLPSLASHLLDTDTCDISFGQAESLTDRLNSLIQDYPDGLSLIKELIQNADDAGATEVRFMYDERNNSYSLEGLIDKGMSEVQGPALWSYNNASFRADDFGNIVKLGGATKAGKSDKIGQFGLGFNVVYNVTDVPSFVSGSKVVIFDPQLTHVGNFVKNKSKPGIILDINKNHSVIQLFQDQFLPFKGIYGCNFMDHKSYSGTLFRFPLRTRSEAQKSKISSKAYEQKDVIELFDVFSRSCETLLLFTQHVKRICIDHLPKQAASGTSHEMWLTVEKQKGFKVLHSASEDLSILKCAKRVFQSSSGANTQSEIAKVTVTCSDSGKKHCSTFKGSTTFWYISTAIGRGKAHSYAKSHGNLVPVAGVAAPVYQQQGSLYMAPLENYSQTFCFLPLPQTAATSLPVHINGFFAVSTNRQQVHAQDSDDKENEKAAWNQILVQDAVVEAYTTLLSDLKIILPKEGKCKSYEFWPALPAVQQGHCQLTSWLVPSLIQNICKTSGSCIFPYLNGWSDFTSMVTVDHLSTLPEALQLMLDVFSNLNERLRRSRNVVEIPGRIQEMLKIYLEDRDTLKRKLITRNEFYTGIFIPNINEIEVSKRDKLVILCLSKEKDISHLFKETNFIPVKPHGKLVNPKYLVHPQRKVAALFDNVDEVFPDITFTNEKEESDCMTTLEMMGMSCDDLCWPLIAERCVSLRVKNKQEIMDKVKLLLNIIEEKLRYEKCCAALQEKIRSAKFLPVLGPGDNNLPWKGAKPNELLSADELFHADDEYKICCIKPIVHTKLYPKGSLHSITSEFLGFTERTVSPQDIVMQLKKISCLNITHSSQMYARKIINAIYEYFHHFLRKYENLPDPVRVELEGLHCILHENKFVEPCRCALYVKDNECSPFLYAIPFEYQRFGKFFLDIGVKERFGPEDYIKSLSEIYINYTKPPTMELDDKMLQKALTLVRKLAECVDKQQVDASTFHDKPGKLFIPNSAGCMCDATVLCYNNCPWVEVDKQVICHPSIAHANAHKLGVKTIRQEVVMSNSLGIPFGQKEKLVNRISRILSGYPFDHTIMNEMVQNADDAGATEVHFILDKRSHPTAKLLDDTWKALQGPALCVYNNKPFSEADISGIQNLGEGTKSNDPCKTGQYGVGFNCVYHLTDTPTFLTTLPGRRQKTLCAFDPTCSSIPGATSNEPGRQFNFTAKMEQDFEDVLIPYLHLDKDYDVSNGTMFRLPLRKRSCFSLHAAENIFDGRTVTPEDVMQLFTLFQKDMSDLLIFVGSVTKVVLSEIDEDGKKRQLYSVRALINAEDISLRKAFSESVIRNATALKNGKVKLQCIPAEQVLYRMEISCGNDVNHWEIVQRFGYSESNDVTDELATAYKRDKLALLPRGGVALPLGKPSKDQNRVFCFLPLPCKTLLPVQINGHFALSSENRRGLWRNENDIKTQWNKHILSTVVVPAYAELLLRARQYVKSSNKKTMDRYLKLFPAVQPDDKELMGLCHDLYKYFVKQSLAVLPVLNCCHHDVQWVSISQSNETPLGYFDTIASQLNDLDVQICDPLKKKTRGEISLQVRKVLEKLNMNIIVRCNAVYSNFRLVGEATDSTIRPELCLQQVQKVASAMCQTPCALKDSLFGSMENAIAFLLYCRKAEGFFNFLEDMPLLITADSIVRSFSVDYKVHSSEWLHIVPKSSSLFVHPKLLIILPEKNLAEVKLGKSFRLKELSHHLLSELDEDEFFGMDKVTPLGSFVIKSWLEQIWKFIGNCIWNCHLGKEMSAESISHCLADLASWCLLPVCIKKKQMLLPIGRANVVFDTTVGDSLSHALRKAFEKCGLPLFAHNMVKSLDGVRPNPVSKLLATIEKPDQVLLGLRFMMLQGTLLESFSILSGSERKSVLGYFASNLDKVKAVADAVDVLRALPIYTNIIGDYVHLMDSFVYLIPSDIPTNDMDVWCCPNKSGTIFLPLKKGPLQDLCSFINCKSLKTVEVYCTFVLNQFELMQEEAREIHLKYILNLIPQTSGEEQKALIEGLHGLPFIPNSEGNLSLASEFYDPQIKLFVAMGKQLPPSNYHSEKWLIFLRRCGMICAVNSEDVVSFAETIQREAQTASRDDSDLLKKSHELTKHVFDRPNLLTEQILERIRGIKFIPQFVVCPSWHRICPQYGRTESTQSYIKFEGSFLHNHAMYVWSSSQLLPEWCLPTGLHKKHAKAVQKRLGIQTDLSPRAISEHLENICSQLVVPFKTAPTILEIIPDITEQLSEVCSKNCDTSVRERLEKLAFIPVDMQDCTSILVKPNNIVTDHINEEIKPYICSMPHAMWRSEKFLLSLGAQAETNAFQFASALNTIYEDTKSSEIMPNTEKVVQKCMKGLFMALDTFHTLQNLNNLHFPAKFKNCLRMEIANKTIYKDYFRLEYRLKSLPLPFFTDLGLVKEMGELILKALEKLPVGIRPRMLSTIVTEKLEDTCEAFEDEEFRLLRWSSFHEAIRLVTQKMESVETQSKESVSRIINSLTVMKSPDLRTYLSVDGQDVEDSLRVVEFFEERKAEQTVLYFKEGTLKKSRKVCDVLLKLLAIHSNDKNISRDLEDIIDCKNQSSLNRFVEELKVSSENSSFDAFDTRLPGDLVPLRYHGLLMHGFSAFAPKEIVAMRLHNTNELDDDMVEPEGDPVYVYARITDDSDRGVTLGKHKVYITPTETREVESYFIFRFKNDIYGNEHNTEQDLTDEQKLEEFNETMAKARAMDPSKKLIVLKRLYLHWHPDLNNNSALSKEVYSYLMQEIDTMENMNQAPLPIVTPSCEDTTPPHRGSLNNYLSRCFEQHRNQQRRFEEQQRKRSAKRTKPFHFSSFDSGPNPQPGEANRWMKQAKFDIQSVDQDLTSHPEWAAQKCFQAVEKALSALQYAHDANKVIPTPETFSKLDNLTKLVNPCTLSNARRMKDVCGATIDLMYPSKNKFPLVPREVIKPGTARELHRLASIVVMEIDENLSINV